MENRKILKITMLVVTLLVHVRYDVYSKRGST